MKTLDEPPATKPVQTCADCRHELWLDLENRCKHLIPVEVDEMYHETRCGHKCEIPAEVGGEAELPVCPFCGGLPNCNQENFTVAHVGDCFLKTWGLGRDVYPLSMLPRWNTRTSQPAGEPSDVGCTCNHICPPRHEREIDDEVVCVHADYCPLSDNFAAQPSPTPPDEVNRRARAEALEEAAKVAESRWATLSVGKVPAHLQAEVERNAIAASIRTLITTDVEQGENENSVR